MADAFATIISALIGAGSGSVVAAYFTRRLEKSAEDHRRREKLVQRYLLQLQDAVESLWFRFENVSNKGGRSVMQEGYYEVSTLYAWGRVMAYSRILLLDGIYPQLERLEKGLGEVLRDRFYQLDQKLKDDKFQRCDRLALAEAVIEKEEDYLRTSTYFEFRRQYDIPFIKASLQPAKDYIERLQPKSEQLKVVLDHLRAISTRIGKVTMIPSAIESKGAVE